MISDVVEPPQEVTETVDVVSPPPPEPSTTTKEPVLAVSTVDEKQVDKSKAMQFTKVKKPRKKRATAEKEEDRVHSITFYINRKNVKFFTEAFKEICKSIFGTHIGKISRYIRSLIEKDFRARGLLTADGQPDYEGLENLKNANIARAKAS